MTKVALVIVGAVIFFETLEFLAGSFNTSVQNFCGYSGAAFFVYILVKPKIA